MRRAALASLLLLGLQARAGPLAEVWPYQAKRLDTTTLEYAYDLTPVKKAGGNPDVKAEAGEEQVAAFLKGLPGEVKVKVKVQAPLAVAAGRGIEQAPLAASFAATPDGPLASDDPLRRKQKTRLRPALSPDEPKVLPSADMILWRVRRLEDGALAAATIDSDRLLKGWLATLQERALARAKQSDGDTRDGANLLAGRFAAALACLEPKQLALKSREAQDELSELRKDLAALTPIGFWGWNAELNCAWRRSYALGQPFAASRAGYAAGLVMLTLLKEPKLKATWLKLRARRDALLGGPRPEPLEEYGGKAGTDPEAALDDLMPVIDRQGGPPPAPFATWRSPFSEFMSGLQGAERLSGFDELVAALADGRVKLPTETTAPVEALRDSALAAFSVGDVKGLQFDATWRDRLAAAFCALAGAHHELRDSSIEPQARDVLRNELKVVLEVPPTLEVEPLPDAYRRASDAAARLANVLQLEGLSSLEALDPEGNRQGPAVAELKKWQSILAGLAVIASRDPFETPDVANARRFLAGWRADSGLTRDVRLAQAGPIAFEDERSHAVVAGVARRELSVQFAESPTVEVLGNVPGVTFEAKAEQRYLVPVLFTTSYRASATQAPMTAAAVRKAVDAAKGDPAQIPAALAERK